MFSCEFCEFFKNTFGQLLLYFVKFYDKWHIKNTTWKLELPELPRKQNYEISKSNYIWIKNHNKEHVSVTFLCHYKLWQFLREDKWETVLRDFRTPLDGCFYYYLQSVTK